MKTYFALFSIATIASLIATPLIRRLCERYKLLDVPSDVQVHTSNPAVELLHALYFHLA